MRRHCGLTTEQWACCEWVATCLLAAALLLQAQREALSLVSAAVHPHTATRLHAAVRI